MRLISDLALQLASTSRAGDRLIVNAWRDGSLKAADIPIADWSITWDRTRQVQAQATFSVKDETGRLSPWALDDALGVAGSVLQVIYLVGGREPVNVGWYRITSAAPEESWRIYQVGQALKWVSSGASIPVQADDLTRNVVLDAFLSPESPPAGATCLSEITRLAGNVGLAVSAQAGLSDASVPNDIVYEAGRMGAIEDLLTHINAAHRMSSDGVLEVYADVMGEPVWEVAGGDGGALVSVQRRQDIELIANGVVARGTDSEGNPLQAVRLETTGTLSWNGPAKHLPTFLQSPILDTQAKVDAAADQMLTQSVQRRSVPVEITCLPNPALQVGDVVRSYAPTAIGTAVQVDARIDVMTLRGNADGTVNPMVLSASVPYSTLQLIAAGLGRNG